VLQIHDISPRADQLRKPGPVRPDVQGPSRQLLIDGYPVVGCAVLLIYLFSALIF
jgi:hypothetical protein